MVSRHRVYENSLNIMYEYSHHLGTFHISGLSVINLLNCSQILFSSILVNVILIKYLAEFLCFSVLYLYVIASKNTIDEVDAFMTR